MRPVEFQILLSLADGARHGYAILQDMEARAEGAGSVETGTLYRALQRLVEQDFVRPARPPRTTIEEDQRRQYYALTAEGRRAASAEARRMAALVSSARAAKLIPRES
jgi:DNA-binding PadR family transcriptional regulator